jgi:hypothetical protein
MAPHDTSPAELARQREAYRTMTPAQRVQAAAQMSEDVRAPTEAGIRHRHPGLFDDEVRAALVELLVGSAAVPGDAARDSNRR